MMAGGEELDELGHELEEFARADRAKIGPRSPRTSHDRRSRSARRRSTGTMAICPTGVPPTPFPQILDEMASAGYAGTEHDRQFPDDPATLKAALDQRGLALCASYQWVHFSHANGFEQDLVAIDGILGMLTGSRHAMCWWWPMR